MASANRVRIGAEGLNADKYYSIPDGDPNKSIPIPAAIEVSAMTVSITKRIFSIMGLASGLLQASTWNDSLVIALKKKDHLEVQTLLKNRASEGNLPILFTSSLIALSAPPAMPFSYPTVFREFELALSKGIGNSTASQYVTEIENSANANQVREFLARTLLANCNKLNTSTSQSVFQAMLSLARSSSAPMELRVFLLKNLGSFLPKQGVYHLVPFVQSTDSLIKSAACQGIAQMVRSNRSRGNHLENERLFDTVKVVSGEALNLDEVRLMATFSEDYSREYLLIRCAGSTSKIGAVFHSDDALGHLGLLREAMNLSLTEGNYPYMKNSILYGTKNPDAVIAQFLAGPDSDKEIGLRLLEIYPEHVRNHDLIIRNLLGSPSAGVQKSAQALFPLLVN